MPEVVPTSRAARIAFGAVAAFAFSVCAVLLWIFVTHRDPFAPRHTNFKVMTAVYGIVFWLCAGFLAKKIGKSVRAADGVAVLTILFSVIGMLQTGANGGQVWLFWIALFCMAPASILGGRLQMTPGVE